MTTDQARGQNVLQHPAGGSSGVVAMMCILAGWLVAVVLGHGWELYRIVLTVPFLMAGALLACIEVLRGRIAVWRPALMLLFCGCAYFVARASLSPVRDFGRADALLVTMFAISFLGGAVCLRSRKSVSLLLKAMIIVFAGHFLIGIYQRIGDPSFALLRHPRYDQAGVSGLFWHRNYLAGMLELMVPVFGAVLVTTRLNRWRIVSGVVVGLGLILLFLTKSRGGLVATIAGVSVVGALVIVARSPKWTMNKRMAAISAAIIAALLVGWMGLSATSTVSGQRGYSSDLEEALSTNSRLAFAGMAFDQWTEQPLWGTGSRSFSYKAIEHWNAAVWIGDPVMVHNDYMQTLAEYGAVGAVLVVSLAVALLIRGFFQARRPEGADEEDGMQRGLMIGAMGALVAAMTHSVIDFSLHILPNLMLFGLLTGLLVQPGPLDEKSRREGPAPVLMAVGILLVSSAVAFAAGWRDLSIAPQWLRWERETLRSKGGMTVETLDAMGNMLEIAPHFALARSVGRSNLEAYRQDPVTHAHRLDIAEEAFQQATERNPFDAEALANLAFVLELKGQLDEATPIHLRAVERTFRREVKFGTMAAFAENLARRAERHLYKLEKPQALGLYQRALEYLEASRKTGYRSGGPQQSKELRNELVARIETLQAEGVEIQSPPNVPAPPR